MNVPPCIPWNFEYILERWPWRRSAVRKGLPCEMQLLSAYNGQAILVASWKRVSTIKGIFFILVLSRHLTHMRICESESESLLWGTRGNLNDGYPHLWNLDIRTSETCRWLWKERGNWNVHYLKLWGNCPCLAWVAEAQEMIKPYPWLWPESDISTRDLNWRGRWWPYSSEPILTMQQPFDPVYSI